MSKVRAIFIVDLEIDGSYRAIADKEDELQGWLTKLTETDPTIVASTMDMKERRGTGLPDLKNMKLRGI